MTTKTIEQELEGFERITAHPKHEIWAKGKDRILYDPVKKKIVHEYRVEREN